MRRELFKEVKDADCDEEQGDDNVEPVLEALQFSYEFSQVVHAVCNGPCHCQYGDGGGEREYDREEISTVCLRRHGNKDSKINERADRTEGQCEEGSEEERPKHSRPVVPPGLQFTVVMVMMQTVAEEHNESDDNECGCQQAFAPSAHYVLQLQQIAATTDEDNEDSTEKGIGCSTSEYKYDALPQYTAARGDVAADEADGGDIAAQRTGRYTGEESEEEGRSGRNFGRCKNGVDGFCHSERVGIGTRVR